MEINNLWIMDNFLCPPYGLKIDSLSMITGLNVSIIWKFFCRFDYV